MAKIPERFNFGDSSDMSVRELVLKIERMYMDLAEAINAKPDVYQRNTDGQTTDVFLSNGDININLSTDKVEMLTNHNSPTSVTWITLS